MGGNATREEFQAMSRGDIPGWRHSDCPFFMLLLSWFFCSLLRAPFSPFTVFPDVRKMSETFGVGKSWLEPQRMRRSEDVLPFLQYLYSPLVIGFIFLVGNGWYTPCGTDYVGKSARTFLGSPYVCYICIGVGTQGKCFWRLCSFSLMVLFSSSDWFPNSGIFLLIYYAFGTHVYIDGIWYGGQLL